MIVSLPASHRFRCLRPLLFLLVVIPLAAASLTWDLPAQPAADALMLFSEKSGYLVLFSAKELAGLQSPTVQGEHEPLEVLQLILAGSNFEAVSTGQKRVVVRARPLARLTGVVRSGPQGAGLVGATVQIEGRALAAVTARSGHFQLNGLPAGKYTVVISAAGMLTTRIPLVVEAGRNVELPPVTLLMEADGPAGLADSKPPLRLEDMVVMPSRFGVAEGMALPVAAMTHEDLDILPKLGDDLYRAIGRLPGLATTDYSAKFWVRGAPYEQVLARLDGATLLEPFHMKDLDGSLSIIDTEMVARLNLTSGGFTAEYGDRLAGVLEMETESQRLARPHTTLGISLTGVRATSRGSFAKGQGNWLVSGRVGYPDIALKETDSDKELKPRYYDVFAKGEYQLRPGQVVAIHFLHSGDTLTDTSSDGEKLESSYTNDYIWARWRGEFGGNLKGETVLSYAWLGWHRHGSGKIDTYLPFTLSDDRELDVAALRQDWSLLLSDRWLLRTGFEVQNGDAEYRYHRLRSLYLVNDGELSIQPRVIDRNPEPHRLSTAAYVALRFQPVPRLTLETGLRFDRSYYDGAGSGWSPRFNGAYDFGRATLRAAWGRYRQEQGLHEIGVVDGESLLHPAEEAEQRVLGLETRLGSRANFRAEIYQRITENPRPHGENPYNVGEALGELMSDRVLLRPTHAEARGVELILESRGQKTFDWSASYALSRTEETIASVVVPRDRDQRHAFYCDLAWHPNSQWQLTAAWQYHTGWPTSAVVYQNYPLTDGRVVIGGVTGPLYTERLPAYHRLDLRATRTFRLRHSTLRAFVDVFNAYDHDNVYTYSQNPRPAADGSITTVRAAQGLFPILPSVGLIWDF